MSSVNFSDSLVLSFKFWQPAVSKGGPDETSLMLRTMMAGLAAFGALLYRVSRRDPAAAFFIFPGTYGVMMLGAACYQFEKWRAVKETYRIALTAMGTDAAVEISLIEQMKDNPNLLRAYLADPKCDKEKLNTVLERLLQNPYSSLFRKTGEEKVFELLVDHGIFQTKHFQRLSKSHENCGEWITYALNHGKFSAFTESEAFDLWVYAASHKWLAPTLLEKKIDINAQNGKGETPLAQVIREKKLKAVCCLLRHGAAIPESINGRATREYLKEEPALLAALDQAANPPSTLKDVSGFFLFQQPMVIDQSCNAFEVRLIPLITRAYVAATTALLALAAINPRMKPLLPLSACVLLPTAYIFSAWQRGQAKLNEIAKTEFATRFPMHGTTKYIAANKALLDQIPEKELNKLDDEGQTLWDTLCYKDLFSREATPDMLQNFETLVDKVFTPLPDKFPYLIQAIKSGQTAYIKRLLEKVNAEDFSPEQDYQCFHEAQNPATISLLKQAGFYINAENEEGYTPLYSQLSSFSFEGAALVQAFLVNGAVLDRAHKMTYQWKDEEGQTQTKTTTVAELIAKTSRDNKYVIEQWEKKQASK